MLDKIVYNMFTIIFPIIISNILAIVTPNIFTIVLANMFPNMFSIMLSVRFYLPARASPPTYPHRKGVDKIRGLVLRLGWSGPTL